MNPDIDRMLQEADIRPTAVRILVAALLARAQRPLSTLEIEHELDTVDRSSITRALSLLHDHGLVHAIDDGSGSTRYELCRNHADEDSESICRGEGIHRDLHAHFHCRQCGLTECLRDADIHIPPLPDGYRAETASFVITGICAACSASGKH